MPNIWFWVLIPTTHTHTHTHTYIYIYYPCFSLFHISLPNSNLKQNNFIIFWENKTAPKFKINEIYIKKLLLISFKFKNKTKFLNKKLLTNGFFFNIKTSYQKIKKLRTFFFFSSIYFHIPTNFILSITCS